MVSIVEGLTEFLPVSSTGHMIIMQKLLGMSCDSVLEKAFIINIQFGAILSVVALYYKRFVQSLVFYQRLLVGFMPVAVVGLLLGRLLDRLLGSLVVVAVALIVGGGVMIWLERLFSEQSEDQEITWQRALRIGVCQCAAIVPGVSRSLATIMGGMSTGLTRRNAAEFSFFLAVPTMAAATAYSLLKLMFEPAAKEVLREGVPLFLLGNLIAFMVALVSIKFFIGVVARFGFKWFGVYRIVLGALLLILWAFGVLSN